MKNQAKMVTFLLSTFLLGLIAVGVFVPHPNQFYKGNYEVLASDLNIESVRRLSIELEAERLSYMISSDHKTIMVTEKAQQYYKYKNGQLIITTSLKQRLIVELVKFSASLKSLYWKIIY